ncbi:hypothetical protein C3747_133g96 [Trypanosoma cruzi]|uniref:Uncharacterized protein n=1 Tax=Trypanosoma cruzi TaxID=5693 RepID=A0A2V2W9T3_TRYCR|nr:hypothetical protein C3747_133g96 [Trypanosoma cruzi]RNC35351.1 hypothetical protein TcCL_Unassigned01785 [Trypanosoma cruzi]
MRAQRSWLLRHFTFHSILAHYGTKPPLYWMWMRLFTGSSLGGYARTSFGCRVGFVDLVGRTRLHTGRECCPEVPRAAARVLAEGPEMVRPQSVAPRVVSTPVWICGIRTSGLRRSVVRRGQCAAKKWRQRENRRSFPSGVNLLAHRSAARRRAPP